MITPCTDFSSEDNLSMSFCPIGFRVRVPLTKLLFFEIGRKLLDKKNGQKDVDKCRYMNCCWTKRPPTWSLNW